GLVASVRAGRISFTRRGRKGIVQITLYYKVHCVKREGAACLLTYICSRYGDVDRSTRGIAETDEARARNHGRALADGPVLRAGNPGSASQRHSARLYHRADDGVPSGSQEGRPARQKGRKCVCVRSADLSNCRAAAPDRRAAELLRRTIRTGDGAP